MRKKMLIGTAVIIISITAAAVVIPELSEVLRDRRMLKVLKERVVFRLEVSEDDAQVNPQWRSARIALQDLLERLEEHGVDAVGTAPEIFAVLSRHLEGLAQPQWDVAVLWVERDSDVVALKVHEDWPNGENVLETYPLPKCERQRIRDGGRLGWSKDAEWPVTERVDPSIRKDEQAWAQWSVSTDAQLEKQPPLYMARPSADIQVLLSLVDAEGNESNRVPFEARRSPSALR